MDTYTFISEMVKALAWPVAVVILVLLVRGQLARVLDGVKLRSIKKGDWLADFEAVAQEVRAELPRSGQVLNFEAHPNDNLVEIAPTEAVLRSWKAIEHRILSVAASLKVPASNFIEALRGLVERKIVSEPTKDSILGLRNMRNLAVHAPADRLKPQQAREFVVMAEAALWSLEENLKRSKS